MDFQSTRLQAIAEAHGTCSNPWCRVPGEEVHHIVHQQEGGTHEVANLILLCRNCHMLYHLGLIGRRTVRAWKDAISSGQTHTLGVYLRNWPSLPPILKRRLRFALRCGTLPGLVGICSGVFRKTDDPEYVAMYGFFLANAFRQRGRYSECTEVALRLAHAIDVIVTSRGELFGLSLRVRLEILCARIQRGLGEFRGALSRFDGAISIAEADQYAGWHEDTFLARVDQISIRTRLEGTAAEDLQEIERLRTEIRKAHEYQLIRSPVRVAAFFGDLAVAEARSGVQAHEPASVLQSMRSAIETLRIARYTRGYSLRLLNLADMLRTMLPRSPGKRGQLLDEIQLCFESASKAATRHGRIALEQSVIGSSAEHVRSTLSILNDRRYNDLAMESFR